jgi:hypothetical protein
VLRYVDKLTDLWETLKDDVGRRIDEDAHVHAGMLGGMWPRRRRSAACCRPTS